MKAFLKSIIRPLLGPRTRDALKRIRGIQSYELFSHEVVADFVAKPNPIIVEIGCNDGSDTVELLHHMPRATIYCFEPDRRAANRFRSRTELVNVELFEVAIGGTTGTVNFFPSTGDKRAGDFDQAGSIRTPKNTLVEAPWVSFKDPIKIKSYRLDDWCAEKNVQNIDFLWMDVQGAEADVIDGAQKILPSTRFIYTEYSNNELYEGQISLKGLLARLPSFKVVYRFSGDVLLANQI